MHSGMDKKRGGPGGYSGSSRHSPGSSMPSTLPTSYHPPSSGGYSGSSRGYSRNEGPSSHPGGSHYPPHGGRSGGGYYQGRPSSESGPMRPRGPTEGYHSQPRQDYNRGNWNNFPPQSAPPAQMYHQPSHSAEKVPYGAPNSYRPQYQKPMGMMNRPPMDNKAPMREPKPRRNTRWETPISKQEISTFFAQYATFILSAKAYHSNLNASKEKIKMSYHEDKKEIMYNSAPAISPYGREHQMPVYYDEPKSHMQPGMHMGMGGGMLPGTQSTAASSQDTMGNSQQTIDYGHGHSQN